MFEGKVAWITGASSGIGESLVYEFIKRGATVIASSNDLAGLERVKSQLPGQISGVLSAYHLIFRTLPELKVWQKKILMHLEGSISCSTLGGISQRARIDETPLWLDRKIFEINYFGTIALTKAVLPYMIRQKIRTYSCNKQYIRKIWISSTISLFRIQSKLYMDFSKHFILKIKNSISDLLLSFPAE